MKKKDEVWLNLGCGVSLADKPFINIDNSFELEDLVDGINRKDPAYVNARVPKECSFIQTSMTKLPFEDGTVDYIEANDSIEHLSWNEVDVALKEMFRVLKIGGKLAISTLNFDALAKLWTEFVTGNNLSKQEDVDRYVLLAKAIYGNQVHTGEFHKVPFNPYSIAYRLKEAGFDINKINITIFPTGTPTVVVQRAYAHHAESLKGTFASTEGMWVEVIK